MMQTVVQRTNKTPRQESRTALEIPVQKSAASMERKQTAGPVQAVSLTYKPDAPGLQNRTGIPASMLLRAEALSGISMRDVQIHYNSGVPAALGAWAVAQTPHIYLGPGKERYLGHEVGHIIQQKRGVVRPQFQMGGRQINASPLLERDADLWSSRLKSASSPAQFQAPPDWFMAGAALTAGQSFETAQCFFPELWAGIKRRLSWDRIKKSSIWSLIDATQACIANLWGGSVGTTAASCVGITAQIMNALGLWTRHAETEQEAREKCGYILKTVASVLGVLTAAGSDISSIAAAWASEEAENKANFASRGFAVGSDTIGILAAMLYISGDGVNLRAWSDTLAMMYNFGTNCAAMGIMGAGNKDGLKTLNWVLLGELGIRLLRMFLTWVGVGSFRPADLDAAPEEEDSSEV